MAQKSVEEHDMELLTQVARTKYRKQMEQAFLGIHYMESFQLLDQHQKAVCISLDLVNETKPLTADQKQSIKQSLEQMLMEYKEINLQKQQFPGLAIGIDLGTTFCCMAVFRNNREAEIIPNDYGNNKTPSYIAFPNQRSSTSDHTESDSSSDSDEENDNLVDGAIFGETAVDQVYNNPLYTIYDVKRMLGRELDDERLKHDRKYWPFDLTLNKNGDVVVKTGKDSTHTPLEITSLLVKHLKTLAVNFTASTSINAVVTVPAYFNSAQRQLTQEACKEGGINVLQLVNEPTAAAIAYKLRDKYMPSSRSGKFLVFDFGGGTFDLSVATWKGDQIHILAVGGDDHLGGEDIDNNLVDYCVERFKARHGVDLKEGLVLEQDPLSVTTLESTKAMTRIRRLRAECEKKKRFLTSTEKVVISVVAIHGSTDLIVPLTRATFNEINNKLFEKCFTAVSKTLADCDTSKEEILDVVLVGGSSRIPRVQEMLSEFFGGMPIRKTIDEDEAVAIGAAMLAFNATNPEIPNVLIQETQVQKRKQSEHLLSVAVDIVNNSEPKLDQKRTRGIWTLKNGFGTIPNSFATVVVDDSVIFSFGGDDRGVNFSSRRTSSIDVHVLNLNYSLTQWKRKLPAGASADQIPSKRYGYSAVVYEKYVYLWGGWNSCDNLYRFDTQNFRWEKPKVNGSIPSGRYGHAAVIISHKMYIFGGRDTKRDFIQSSILVCDLRSHTWSSIPANRKTPPPASNHTATVYKDRYVFIFGGCKYCIGEVDDFVCFDVVKEQWTYPFATGHGPSKRDSHCAFMHNDFLYIFSGFSCETGTYLNDLYRYDPEVFEWEKVETTGESPCIRRCSGGVVLKGEIFVFMGTGEFQTLELTKD